MSTGGGNHMSARCDRPLEARLKRLPDVKDGVYNYCQPGQRVTFYLPGAGGPNNLATGVIVKKNTKQVDTDVSLGEVTENWPDYLVEVDGATAGRLIHLTGAAIAPIPEPTGSGLAAGGGSAFGSLGHHKAT